MPNKYKDMKAVEFLEKSKIKYCPIKVEYIIKDGIIVGKDYKDNVKLNNIFTIDYQPKLKYRLENIDDYQTLGIDTNEYIQLDIDIKDEDHYNSLTVEEQELYNYLKNSGLPMFKSLTKPYGFHIILNISKSKIPINKDRISDESKFKKDKKDYDYMLPNAGFIEILCGLWGFIKKDTPIEFSKEKWKKMKINDEILEKILKPIREESPKKEVVKKEKKPKEKITETPIENDLNDSDDDDTSFPSITKLYIELLKNIDMRYIDNYDDFYKILYAAANESNLKNTVKYIGSTSELAKSNYDSWFNNLWTNAVSHKGNYSINFINSYSKCSNKSKHYKLLLDYDTLLNNDIRPKDLFELFYNNNLNNLLCVNSVKKPTYWLYNIIKKLWIDISQNEAEIKYEISSDLEYYTKEKLSILQEKLSNLPEEEELKIKTLNKEISKYEKLYYQLGDTMIINKIWEIGKGRLSYSAYNTNKFDDKPNLFCFNDKLYDFATHTFRDIEQTDFITKKLPYNYNKPDKKIKNEFVEKYLKVLVKDEVFNDLMFILASCLIGQKFQYFYVFNGGGSNGKSLLQTILKELLGEGTYYETGGGDIMAKPIDTSKPNPQLSKIHNTRCYILSEPKEEDPIAIDTMKRITGDETLSVRGLFTPDGECKLIQTTILLCNVKPDIKGRSNNAIERRVKDILFPYEFKNDKDFDKENPLHRKASSKFKESNKEWIRETKFCLFDYLIDWIKDYEEENGVEFYKCNFDFNFSQETIKRSKDYIKDSDVFKKWFDTNYIKINSDNLPSKKTTQYIIPCKPIHIAWKNSEDFTKLSKEEKHKDMKDKDFYEKTLLNSVYKEICKSYSKTPIQLYNSNNTRTKKTHVLHNFIKRIEGCECYDLCTCNIDFTTLPYGDDD